jgi:hypothetical protein
MLRNAIHIIAIVFLCAGTLFGQQNNSNPYYKWYVGSSAFMLGNFAPDPPSFYQLNFGYRVTPKDVVSLEAITWKNNAPIGIPYGSSFGEDSEKYPGSIREYGIGVVYQRFLWKGLYTSLQALPLRTIYLDVNDNNIQKGLKLFSTFRMGYHIPLFKNRFFVEPSIAFTYWPVNTNVPQDFKVKDDKWNNYFLFEPGLHFGAKF